MEKDARGLVEGIPGSAPSLGNSEKPPIPLLQAQSRATWSGTV